MSEEKKKRLLSASNSALPLISVLPDRKTMNAAKKLMAESADLKVVIDGAEARRKEINEELAVYAEANGLPGFRHGMYGFQYSGWTSRQSLSREKLVENGVDPEAIAASMVDGTPYLNCKVIVFDVE